MIQGVFFQIQDCLGLGYDAETHDIGVFVREELFRFMYAGMIWIDQSHPLKPLIGALEDQFGKSVVSEISLLGDRLHFIKRYDNRNDQICYTFTRQPDNTWAGEYMGERVGTGVARCILTEVDESFFESTSIMEFLGRRSAHTWPSEERAANGGDAADQNPEGS